MGASPDNFVVKIKCPMNEKSIKRYIKDNTITKKFKSQIMMQMYAHNKGKTLFCIADPLFEENKVVHKYWVRFDSV